MSEQISHNLGGLDVDLAHQIDAACRRFEADWRTGKQPPIDDYLADVPEAGRSALRAELAALECELRRSEETGARVEAPVPPTIAEAPTIAPGLPSTLPVPGTAPAIHEDATLPPREDATVDLGPSVPDRPDAEAPSRIRYFGDYEIVRELARGGMGVVFQARQVSLNRPVALKMILAGQLADEAAVRRFYLEAEAAANLDHPGIVPIYEVGAHEGQHYFSMGFVEGQSLAHKIIGGPLPPGEAAALMVKVAEAIEYAHRRGVIHRDLKPANILLDPAGNPRVTDFGLAKKLEGDSGLTGSGQIMGTPSYMPPEQAGGKRGAVGPAADVYALGATLYALVTGRPPFQAATGMDIVLMVLGDEPVPPRRLNGSIPRDLETICLKCLEKDPKRRYPSAAELGADLERFRNGEPIRARRVGRLERAGKWARRNPMAAALAFVVLAALATVIGLGVRDLRRSRATIAVIKAERDLADAAREDAQAQAGIARANEREARTQADLAERRLYGVNLVRIQRAREDEDTGLFRKLLDEQRRSESGADRRGFEWFYWTRRDRAGVTVWRQPGRVTSVAFSSDGRWLASGSTDQTVIIRDARSGTIRTKLKAPHPIFHVAFSPDGRWCGATSGNLLVLWELDKGTPPRVFMDHTAIAFSPDSRQFLTLGKSGFAFHDVTDGKAVLTVETPVNDRLALSRDGARVAIAGFAPGTRHEVVQIRDAKDGRLLSTLAGESRERPRPQTPHRKGVTDVALSPDGHWCALSGDHVITAWDLETGRVKHVFDTEAEPHWEVAFSPDSRWLATAGGNADDTIRIYDIASGRLERRLRGHEAHISGLTFSPDGRRLASGDGRGTIRVWDPDAPEALTIAFKAEDPLAAGADHDLDFGPDGRWLVATGGAVALYDPIGGRNLATLPKVQRPIALGADRSWLVSPDRDRTEVLQVWDLSRPEAPTSTALRDVEPYARVGKAIGRDSQLYLPIASLAVAPDGRQIAVGRDSGVQNGPHGLVFDPGLGAAPLRLLDRDTGRAIWTVSAHSDRVGALAFSPDGLRIASSSLNEGIAKIWDATNGRELARLKGHSGLCALRFSPDGRWLATSGFNDGLVKLWDAANGRERHTLRRHSGPVLALAFSPDGQRLASTGADGRIELWDVRTTQSVLSLKAHQGWASALAFSPDGHLLASFGRMDHTIKVWDARPMPTQPDRP